MQNRKPRRFIQCDVFSPTPTLGNALAVVIDAEGLSEDSMVRFARWTNLAETTFLFPPESPDADYKVRIFSPTREMPFAGHPTLGSCAAWLHAGGIPREAGMVHQECAVGIVKIDISRSDRFAFTAPPTKFTAMDDARFTAILDTLEIPRDRVVNAVQLENGPIWQMLELKSAADVLAADSSRVSWPEFKAIGLIGAHGNDELDIGLIGKQSSDSECDYEVRMLAPSSGMSEDPITGSLNSAIAHWLQSEGRLTKPITVAQGQVIDRYGRVFITPLSDTDVSIGGHTHIVVDGVVNFN